MRRNEILKLGAIIGIVALGLTLWVGYEQAPIAGDVSLTKRIQDISQLQRNEGFINALNVWLWAFLGGAVLLALFRHRIGGRRPRHAQQREALAAFAAGVVLLYGSQVLKELVQSPRPVAEFGVRVDHLRGSYGFPSGHVYGDVLIYGLLAVMAPAYVAPRLVPVVRVLCLAVILLAGPARIVIGAHWPSDTVGGYLWGSAALCLAVWFGRWVSQRA
jgi:membrane-associated phospholipid phosphatase